MFNRPPCTRPTLSNPSTQLKKGKPPSQPCTNLAPPLPTDGIPGSKFKSRGFSGREFEKTWITSVFFSRARFRARARVRRFTRYHKVCEGDKPTLYLYCSTRAAFIVNARNKRSNYGHPSCPLIAIGSPVVVLLPSAHPTGPSRGLGSIVRKSPKLVGSSGVGPPEPFLPTCVMW